MSNTSAEMLFNKAVEQLQVELKILPVGIAAVGAWKYAYIYDLTPRHFPWLVEKSGIITEKNARETIIEAYFYSIGAVQSKDIYQLFHWPETVIEKTLGRLSEKGVITGKQEMENIDGEFYFLTELLS